jgi:hypothetical protein
MRKFGIVGEGITDQITIENILCGFFDSVELEDDINYLQPPRNKPDKGGWGEILKYLAREDFRNDILNNEFVILQIDTDVSNDFDVLQIDENNNELTVENLVNNVIIKLITKINEGQLGFYSDHADKFIFAISVSSLDCWLVAYYVNYYIEQVIINNEGCFSQLRKEKFPNNFQVAKNHSKYNILSKPFLNPDNIHIVAQKSPSFNLFIQQLQNIPL